MLRNICLASLAVMICSAACLAEGDKAVEGLITKGLAAHKAGKTHDAIAALQEAILLMQKSQEKGLAGFFPKAPAGWTAGELDSSSAAFGTGEGGATYTTLTQQFTREEDGATVNVSLSNSNQLVEAHKAMAESYKNPEVLKMMNQDPNTKVKLIDKDGWTGWMTIEKDNSAQAIAFSSGCLLTVQVDKGDEATLELFWNAIDHKALAKATVVEAKTKPADKE